MFIETHCHLDYLKAHSLDEILRLSKDGGVEKIITIAVQDENLDKVLAIASSHPQVYCSQGIHPHHAVDTKTEALLKIRENLKSKKVVAIGEIGLDYYYNKSPRDVQIKVFEEYLNLAIEFNLPVIIHTRDAEDDTVAILKNFSPQLKRKGVLHSFTSKKELAEYALKENFCLGFNGIITFKNAQNVREIVEITPIEQILFETDAPFLTPVPHRGKENGPQYLPLVADKISEIKNIEKSKLYRQVLLNTNSLFFGEHFK